MEFDKKYYNKVIRENNYNPLEFKMMETSFFGIPADIMKQKWLCHSGIDCVNSKSNLIITTGVGLSGIPHMGTLSQILRIIFLQKQGFNVQLVLGDLDSYNARGKTLSEVIELSKKYKEFINKLGFDDKLGILRNQLEYQEINQCAYLS